MGLTRYWTRPPDLEPGLFLQWSEDCRRLLDRVGTAAGLAVHVRGPDGFGTPVVTEYTVVFNGDANAGLDGEPFEVERNVVPRRPLNDQGCVFQFCKTGGKPYDVVVLACLLALKRRFGSAISIEADAGIKEMVAGEALFHAVLGSD